MDILNKRNQLEAETEIRYRLITFLSVTVFSLVIILVLYRKQRSQQKKIRLQNDHLLELDEEKNTLVKILAHDLRAPINHMQGLSQVLLLTDQLNDDQKEIVNNIDQSATRLNKMILNILDVDAVEHNRTKLSLENISVCTLLKSIVESFQNEAKQKIITLSLACSDSDKTIHADRLFLTQVFENLISNALKFSPSGTHVDVWVSEMENKIHVRVKDEGPGISAAELPFLFVKFKKLSARPTSGESSIGLGLSIVKKYVELMRGKVWCESELGNGATFIVEFWASPGSND
jgi:signal transduction histidine kinase